MFSKTMDMDCPLESHNFIVCISISEMLIQKIKLWDSSEQFISIVLENVKMNISLSDASFKFTPPKGVDIFDQRE